VDSDLVCGEVARETYSIYPDDPLSARVGIHWTETMSREDMGWAIRTETYSTMRSDEEYFYLTGRIEAYEGDDLVFEKDFRETISRELV